MKHKKVKTAYGKKPRHETKVGKISLTKQSFTDECDINSIMRRFQKTGALDHVKNHQQNYGFATSEDFTSSMQLVATAQSMFNELPSTIRKEFNNEPGQFLDFVQNPENAQKLEEMGLATQTLKTAESLTLATGEIQEQKSEPGGEQEKGDSGSKDATLNPEKKTT